MRTGARKLNRQLQGTAPASLVPTRAATQLAVSRPLTTRPAAKPINWLIVVEVNWIRIAGELNETLDVVGCDDPFEAFHLARLELMETFLAHGGPLPMIIAPGVTEHKEAEPD
jgi:hypothetical protein